MFYVYYLHCAETGELLYIGRSDNPKGRQRAFHDLHHKLTVMGMKQRHSTFEAACAAELTAIARHRPPYNKLLASGAGAFGYKHTPEALARMRSAASKPKSEATRKRMSQPKSEETKAKMRKPKTPEHAAKLAVALAKGRATMSKRRSS